MVPYVFIWLLLTLLYLTMPNTTVSWRAGLAAGVVAGTLYQLLQFGYFQSLVNVARYNAIYGSFAALPLFLIWLHLSWLVVLVGAEVSFAVDNAGDYARERAAGRASHHQRRLIALALTGAAVGRFLRGEAPATPADLAAELGVPLRLAQEALGKLEAAGVLLEVRGSREGTLAYSPAGEPAGTTVAAAAAAFDQVAGEVTPGDEAAELAPDAGLQEMAAIWRAVVDEGAGSGADLSLDALARRLEGGPGAG
jgi:membrane protein